MMLLRSDLMTENKQNSNAGNGGDLLKHSAYLALLDELVSREPWHHEIHIVEAHSGKGVYAATSSHLREARQLPDYAASRLGIAQTAAFADPPLGFPVQLPESEMANCLTLGHLCFTLVK